MTSITFISTSIYKFFTVTSTFFLCIFFSKALGIELFKLEQPETRFHAPTGHFPPLILSWLPMPRLVQEEGAEGGTSSL